MFFSTFVLTKRGTLAKIWLAAHWEKKLTKHDVRLIDLNQAVVNIINPSVPIALRTSGELLIGVVRIYAMKVRQLLREATDRTAALRVASVQVLPAGSAAAFAAGRNLLGAEAAKGKDVLKVDLALASGGATGDGFSDIADILRGAPSLSGAANAGSSLDRLLAEHGNATLGGAAPDILGTAWFTVEPASSQMLEEQLGAGAVGSQSDDIARIRAHMRELGRNESNSKSTSSSGSVASAERARLAGNNIGDNILNMALPTGEDAANALLMAGAEGLAPEDYGVADPVFPEDALQQKPLEQPETVNQNKQKKSSFVIDSSDTVMDIDVMRRLVAFTNDTICQEPRRGSLNMAEVSAMNFMHSLSHSDSVIRAAPYSLVLSPVLCRVYETAVHSAAQRAAAALEEMRASGQAPADAVPYEDYGLAPDPMAEAPPHQEDAAEPTATRKRPREDPSAFSNSALAALEQLCTALKAATSITFAQAAAAPVHDKAAPEAPPRRRTRVEIARFFVDVLALASHDVVKLRQNAPYSDITLMKTSTTLTTKP